VTTKQDASAGERRTQPLEQTAQDADRSELRWRIAWPQNVGKQGLLGLVIEGQEAGDRQVAPAIVMSVEERQLLAPVGRVVSRIEVDRASLPPRLLRLLPAGATVAGWGSHPLEDRAFARRTEFFRLENGAAVPPRVLARRVLMNRARTQSPQEWQRREQALNSNARPADG
jgi:hypothetical protein